MTREDELTISQAGRASAYWLKTDRSTASLKPRQNLKERELIARCKRNNKNEIPKICIKLEKKNAY